MKEKIFGLALLVVVVSSVVVSCQMDDQMSSVYSLSENQIPSFSLTQTSMGLAAGDTTLLAIVSNDVTASAEATWISSDSQVAEVDQTGEITAISSGATTITVTIKGVSMACRVIVIGKKK